MGLLGDGLDQITDGFDWARDTVEEGCRTVGVCDDTTDGGGSGSDGIDDTIDETEDSINDGVGDTTDPIGDGIDEGTDTIFDFGKNGLDAIEGFLNWVAGVGDTIHGIGSWIQNNADIIPLAGDGIQLAGAFIGGVGNVVAGLFHGLAGGVDFLEGIPAFLSTLNGWEGAGFLLGLLLVIVGLYLIVSGILSGEVLLVTSYTEDAFDAVLGSWIGLGLMIWAAQNFTGSVLIAGTGAILLFYALVTDEGQLLIFGAPATILGFFLFFAALKAGFVANVVFTSAVVFALVYATEYLEKRVAPSVTQDQNLLLEGES